MPYCIYFDQDKCVACGTCSLACLDQCDINVDELKPLRQVFSDNDFTGAKPAVQYYSLSCMHCRTAPCLHACPAGCYETDRETGLVILKNQNCIGCRTCEKVCELGAIVFDKGGKANKCNGCVERLKLGLPPACERACQEKAIRFEYVGDPAQAGGDPDSVARLVELRQIKRSDGKKVNGVQ